MVYKCSVLAGNSSWSGITYSWQRFQADTDPMSVKCQYFILSVPACWRYRHDALNQSWVIVGPPSVTLAHIQHGARHGTVTRYWANVGWASQMVGNYSPALGQRLVFDHLHDRKSWRKKKGRQTHRPSRTEWQTERTGVIQYVSTSV